MNKTAIISWTQIFLLIGMAFAVSYTIWQADSVEAAGTLSNPSVCCERTTSGAWCINTDEASCDSSFKSSPTSCETTSYCKLGTCYDSSEGICMENTPQRVCQENGGAWDARDASEIPQCQLGCCIIADQAAFVPLVRCKRLSTLFGVANDYRTDITDEVSCVAEAQSQDMGACVYEEEYERTCKFTTRNDCGAANVVEAVNGTNVTLSAEKRFYKDYLCSAEELSTSCARQTTTGCYNGKVYFYDSCGNRENVYSSDLDTSWNNGHVADPDDICPGNDGSDKECGNCDYLLGSRCSEWDGILGKPEDSDYYCKATACGGRKNGESWCVYDASVGEGSDPVGSRHYKEVCVDGETVVEACSDARQEVCMQGTIEGANFETAACRDNRWETCVAQTEQGDCENIDQRDCMWLPAVTGLNVGDISSGGFSNPTSSTSFSNPSGTEGDSITGGAISPLTGMALFGFGDDDEEEEVEETTTNRPNGVCVAEVPVGLEFWADSEAVSHCGQVSAKCVVKYEESAFGGKKCIENCECLEESWALAANTVCRSVGDCGAYVNYVGDYNGDGYEWAVDGVKKELSAGAVQGITSVAASSGDDSGNFLSLGTIAGGLAATGVAAGLFGKVGTEAAAGTFWAGAPSSVSMMPNLVSGFSGLPGLKSLAPALGMNKNWLAAGAWNSLAIGGIVWVAAKFIGFDNANAIGGAAMAGLFAGNVAGNLAYAAGTTTVSSANLPGIVEGARETFLATAKVSVGPERVTIINEGAAKILEDQGYKVITGEGGEITGLTQQNGLAQNAGFVNLATTILVAILVYKLLASEESTEVVEFKCLTWQAPNGGNNCEECNDPDLPCSEYRCKSLGQACELVNEGTEVEQCVYVNPRDTNPPVITPNKEDLTYGYEYTNVKPNPPSAGLEIIRINSSDGCVKAFERLEFGLDTDEPAQCKIDIEHKESFDEMSYWMGGSNLYTYNHTEKLILPGPDALENGSIILENGNEMNLYVRCMDKNGNTNQADYAIRFCVDETPDNTAPQVQATSITNGGCVAADTDTADMEFYVNEPAECRWSMIDQDYDSMDNQMSCSTQVQQLNALTLYTCKTTLTGVARDETTYYVRCKDQPGKTENDRNENKQSYEFNLRGSTALKIKNLQPNSTIYGAVNPAPVELYVETLFGCDDGKAICYYSETGSDNDYIMFYDTDSDDGIHTQRLDLGDGKHKYYYKCVDSGGNAAVDSTEFRLEIDTSAPTVARVYEEDDMLKIVTVRDSECAYSFDDCDFSFSEGTSMPYANSTTHVTEWNEDKTYYIKCRDEFKNEEADCSVIVRPTRNFL